MMSSLIRSSSARGALDTRAVTAETFCFKLNWQKLREARRREGSYLLRSNLTGGDPAKLWAFYLQLVEIEQAFKELKGVLANI
jgi:hypothetical protein